MQPTDLREVLVTLLDPAFEVPHLHTLRSEPQVTKTTYPSEEFGGY
jgi:hypothetical protein